jgi:NAD-dependent dihydropyrimidine dehydrogenase PreA subunit
VIEVVSDERCIRCDICVRVWPANVFAKDDEGLPVIARQQDCQTRYLC